MPGMIPASMPPAFMLLVLSSLAAAVEATAPKPVGTAADTGLPRERILATVNDGGRDEESFSFPLRFTADPRDPPLIAWYGLSSKGNGGLTIGKTMVRIYHAHDDGHVYEGGLLQAKLVDLDGDGVAELILYGIDDTLDERDHHLLRRTPILSIWKLTADHGGLTELVHDDGIPSHEAAQTPATAVGFLPRERILDTRVPSGTTDVNFAVPIPFSKNPQDPPLVADYDLTSKGNGCLTVGDTMIKIYDIYQDCHVFEGDLLNERLIDLDGDGVREIIVYGIDDETGEKDDIVIRRTPIMSIWKLKPDRSGMTELVHDDLISPWTAKP